MATLPNLIIVSSGRRYTKIAATIRKTHNNPHLLLHPRLPKARKHLMNSRNDFGQPLSPTGSRTPRVLIGLLASLLAAGIRLVFALVGGLVILVIVVCRERTTTGRQTSPMATLPVTSEPRGRAGAGQRSGWWAAEVRPEVRADDRADNGADDRTGERLMDDSRASPPTYQDPSKYNVQISPAGWSSGDGVWLRFSEWFSRRLIGGLVAFCSRTAGRAGVQSDRRPARDWRSG